MEFLNKKKYGIPIVFVFAFFMFYKPAVCSIILGFLLTLYSIHYWIFLLNIRKNGITGMGKIIFYKTDDEGYKTPIIEIITKEGNKIIKEPYFYSSTDLSKLRSYKDTINTTVNLLIDNKNPERFIIKSEQIFNFIILIFVMLIGLIFLTIGILSLIEVIYVNYL